MLEQPKRADHREHVMWVSLQDCIAFVIPVIQRARGVGVQQTSPQPDRKEFSIVLSPAHELAHGLRKFLVTGLAPGFYVWNLSLVLLAIAALVGRKSDVAQPPPLPVNEPRASA